MEDWRLQGQERFLMRAAFARKRYTKHRDDWDHDHCEFCGRKFSQRQGDLNCGYVTADGRHWVCDNCFEDFRQRFHWETDDSGHQQGSEAS